MTRQTTGVNLLSALIHPTARSSAATAQEILSGFLNPVLSTCIVGQCVSEDEICIIGRQTRTTEFSSRMESNEKVKEDWRDTRFLSEDSHNRTDSEAWRCVNRIRRRLEESPPTATLGWVNAEESPTSGYWYCECMIPIDILKTLEADLLTFRVRDFVIHVEWTNGLVDGGMYAPPRNAKWGLLTFTGNQGPLPMYGHVTSIGWKIGPAVTRRRRSRQANDGIRRGSFA